MRKILVISTSFLVFLTLLLVLTGCSKTPGGTDANSQKGQNDSNASKGGNMRQPDFGQPERPADIRGVVKSIVGNSVTVLKIDIANGRQFGSGNGATGSTSTAKMAPAISLGGNTIPGGASGGRGANGSGGGFVSGGGPMEQNGETRAQMLEKLKAMSTGEETVVIPVGIQMLKPSTDSTAKKRTMVEATLSDVTADKTITVWLNPAVTDKKVADFVLIN